MSQFINLSEAEKNTHEGLFVSFAKRELKLKTDEKAKFYYLVIFSDGSELILLHQVLIKLLMEAAKEGKITAGCKLKITQGEKIEKEGKQPYYEYRLFIDDKSYTGNMVSLSPEEFTKEL